jgi:hypothetical protein
MIQRMQSLWLLLAASAAMLSLKFPFYIGTNESGQASYSLTGTETIPIIIATVVICTISFISIFLYRSRPMQLKLCFVGILAEVVLILLYQNKTTGFTAGGYALSSILQPCILLFFLLAARGIRSDEKLIRDSERLR